MAKAVRNVGDRCLNPARQALGGMAWWQPPTRPEKAAHAKGKPGVDLPSSQPWQQRIPDAPPFLSMIQRNRALPPVSSPPRSRPTRCAMPFSHPSVGPIGADLRAIQTMLGHGRRCHDREIYTHVPRGALNPSWCWKITRSHRRGAPVPGRQDIPLTANNL